MSRGTPARDTGHVIASTPLAPRRQRRSAQSRRLPASIARRFEAAVFDWDGTAVPDRRADARDIRRLVERLSCAGFDIAIVSGTNVGNVDSQLAARPEGPGRLYLCMNRGSEVFAVGRDGPALMYRRTATADEGEALTAAARDTVARLGELGLRAEMVTERLNRRKIDLIPEPEWADPPKERIEELLTVVETRLHECGLAGLAEVAEHARSAARRAGLDDPRVTSDVKHVEIGLTDKSNSACWIFGELARCGLGPGAVLIAGDEFGPIGGLPGSDSLLLVEQAASATSISVGVEPNGVPGGVVALGGGPAAFVGVLEDQLRRREMQEQPLVDADPEWTLTIDGFDATLERAHEALLTIGDGTMGTSGSPLVDHPASSPRVLVGGVYEDEGAESRLLEGPGWSQVRGELDPEQGLRRVLDLRAGLLFEESSTDGESLLRSVRFSSASRPGTVALRAEGPGSCLRDTRPLVPPTSRRHVRSGKLRHRDWVQVRASHGGVSAAAHDTLRRDEETTRLERLGVVIGDSNVVPEPEQAVGRLLAVEDAGFERLLHEHRAAWGERWGDADVRIEGDCDLQRAIRLALFQLMSSVATEGETALGARGLTGPGYRGHVFWDTDVFVLPFLAATRPQAARTLLEYRLRRLPAARREARAAGRAGARFPWESARSGRDVTPSHAHLPGEVVPIRTGELEEHVVADVAWAAACYLDWTGDEEFRVGPGLTLFVETARYWAARIRLDETGRGHIEGVIGPDEYHEAVDDNAFTNVMARWNLRRAAQAAAGAPAGAIEESEQAHWLALANALVDGYDPATGIYEQFAGFSELEPLVIEEIAPRRPVAAELLLGHERLRGAQVVKQADVLMLHHLLPNEVVPDSLKPNLLFYEPRTAHASSLSPGIHAGLFARAELLTEALEWLRLASRIDLDDLTQTTAGGLHLAAMGSVWQALAVGFVGARPDGDVLRLDPHLPDAWRALELSLRFRGARVKVRVERDALTVTADPPVHVLAAGRKTKVLATPAGLRLVRHGHSWRKAES
jgi:trehalose/maltose hydrolase-like predicted phosphorylase